MMLATEERNVDAVAATESVVATFKVRPRVTADCDTVVTMGESPGVSVGVGATAEADCDTAAAGEFDGEAPKAGEFDGDAAEAGVLESDGSVPGASEICAVGVTSATGAALGAAG